MRKLMELLRLSLEEFEQECQLLASKIRGSGFKPDVILGIARGGLVPAVYLCDALDVSDLSAVQIKLYDERGVKGKLQILDYTRRNLKGKKVLVVDDVSDSGETLLALGKRLEEQGVAEYKVACLHSKPGTKRVPDFFAKETNAWVQYPWNKREEKINQ